MKKSIMKFNVLIFTGLLGLGLMTSPIDAEEGQETRANEKSMSTEVIYESTEYDINPLDVIVMTIPSDVNFTKKTTVRDSEVSIKLTNKKNFSDYNGTDDKKFETIISVTSNNTGKLVSADSTNSIEANYILKNKKNGAVNWTDPDYGNEFIRFDDTYELKVSKLTQPVEFRINPDQYQILETANSGSRFNDVLTFRIKSIKGNGFISYTGK